MTMISGGLPRSTSPDPRFTVPKTMPASCHCNDRDLDRLRDLMSRGVPQWEASLAVWSPSLAPSEALAVRDPGCWARRSVRASLAARLPWLRLPTPSTEVS